MYLSAIIYDEFLMQARQLQVIEQRMTEREELIRDLASRFHIKGFEQSPIEREEAQQFLAALNDVKRRQHAETDRLQVESRSRNDEYNVKSRQLHTELESQKQERRSLRDRVVKSIQDWNPYLPLK